MLLGALSPKTPEFNSRPLALDSGFDARAGATFQR